ncbi:hypothetical protein OAA09_01005 [bacterium]|nr:hypothetical protein [bacterium]
MTNSILAKVVLWRMCSITITGILTYSLTDGSLKEATLFTALLHSILIVSHYSFEKIWKKAEKSYINKQ